METISEIISGGYTFRPATSKDMFKIATLVIKNELDLSEDFGEEYIYLLQNLNSLAFSYYKELLNVELFEKCSYFVAIFEGKIVGSAGSKDYPNDENSLKLNGVSVHKGLFVLFI